MTGRVRAVWIGTWSALQVPIQLRGTRLRGLLRPAAITAVTGASAPHAELAVRAARWAVRVLGRVPGLPWRNTCLYRSVAECVALRRLGVPVELRIGVKNQEPPHGSIVAHGWVVRSGEDAGAASDAVDFVPMLTPPLSRS